MTERASAEGLQRLSVMAGIEQATGLGRRGSADCRGREDRGETIATPTAVTTVPRLPAGPTESIPDNMPLSDLGRTYGSMRSDGRYR